MKRGKVFIVGAGPGDPELITVRGKRLVQMCDVLLYDHLVHPDIVALARRECEKVYVGKVSGRHSMPQDEINRLLVDRARRGKVVVRLKGGDPVIFGRAGEEMEWLDREGVDYEVVPGVTAASAAASRVKMPLTHRDHASVVTFITGHRKGNAPLSLPFDALAALGGTMAVYMGVATCGEIAASLMDAGMPRDTGVLIAQNVGLEGERFIFTTLGELPEVVVREGVKPPSLFIMGKIVLTKGRK